MKLAAGRGYSAELGTDSNESVIVNEGAVKALGWPLEEAVGKIVGWARRNSGRS